MADNKTVDELADLARWCGIALEYRDNYGVRRRVRRATLEALLAAMGISCETAAARQLALSQLPKRVADRLLPPVITASPGKCRLALHLWSPLREAPSRVEIAGDLVDESGATQSLEAVLVPPGLPPGVQLENGHRLQVPYSLPLKLQPGYYRLQLRVKSRHRDETGSACLVVSPGTAYLPAPVAQGKRLWGFNLPLYALQSRDNWGIGDFADLEQVISWAGRLGAAFVGVNPLHARGPRAEADPSPYSPTSRLFLDFLYINPDKVPERQDLPEAQALMASQAWRGELARLREVPLVAYPEVCRVKRRVLKLLFASFAEKHGLPYAPHTLRGEEFARFVLQGGENLRHFALFQALAEFTQEADWRLWPEPLQHPDAPAAVAFAEKHPQWIFFHQYVQWLAATQRQEVWARSSGAGLTFTLYQDLALGAAAGGFETWAHAGLFAKGAAMGAPPDAFNPLGQNWGLPPVIPLHLQESGYRLFIDTLRANLPPGGMVRLDHVMALFRLFWVPAALGPETGAYVRYPARDLLAILTLESHRQRTLIIGEDLGTVAPRIRRDLAKARVFSYRVFYFERGPGCQFSPPESYPSQAIATATTHDLPTLAGYWEGCDLELKRRLNLYPSPDKARSDVEARQADRRFLTKALAQEGLLSRKEPPSPNHCPEDLRLGVLEYLGKSPAGLVEVRLEDALGFTLQQNLPGTTSEHPNWRQKIPLTLEDLQNQPVMSRLAERMGKSRKDRE